MEKEGWKQEVEEAIRKAQESWVLDDEEDDVSLKSDLEGDRDGTREGSSHPNFRAEDVVEVRARAEFLSRFLAWQELGVLMLVPRVLAGLEKAWKYQFSCEGVEPLPQVNS